MHKTTRRKFIKDCAAVSIAASLVGGLNTACSKATAADLSPFGRERRDCFIAIMEQFIPADDKWGGATQAGCINFMENWVTRYHPEQLDLFMNIGDAVEKNATALYGNKFQNLSCEKQIEFLKEWEKGDAGKLDKKSFNAPISQCFKKMLDMAMMGFYGGPRHGGNKDFISYRMMGMDVPLLIGQNRYNAQNSSKK